MISNSTHIWLYYRGSFPQYILSASQCIWKLRQLQYHYWFKLWFLTRGIHLLNHFINHNAVVFHSTQKISGRRIQIEGSDQYTCEIWRWMYQNTIWVFPKIEVPQNGWFIMENTIKMDDLGGKPTIFGNTHIFQLTDLFPNHLILRPKCTSRRGRVAIDSVGTWHPENFKSTNPWNLSPWISVGNVSV